VRVCRRTNLTKLETRIPAGFVSGLAQLVPAVEGIDFNSLLEQAAGRKLDLSKPLVDLDSGNDIVQIWLE